MGRVMFGGGNIGMKAPVAGILAKNLAVGSTVYLMENGAPVEYLVVNQGIPSNSSLYDSSCDGTWLLRKDIYAKGQWMASDTNNDYQSSVIHSWMNNTYFPMLGTAEQAAVKQIKIPYTEGAGNTGYVASGTNGLSVKVFVLASVELGIAVQTNSSGTNTVPTDGACLEYFSGAQNSARIAYLDGVATYWWTRSVSTTNDYHVHYIFTNGTGSSWNAVMEHGYRPALVIDENTMFDRKTMTLMEVV